MNLIDACRDVIVIAYRENTMQLVVALQGEGFHVHVQRAAYSPEQLTYSGSVRCLLNHAAAWQRIVAGDRLTIVVEADFVPCRDFGTLPLPFGASRRPAFGWLYSAGSILYGIDPDGFPHGHGNTTVAYILDERAATALRDFAVEELATHDPHGYVSWETRLGIFLRRSRDILNHIPLYQYGEHGGLPNPEHRRAGRRDWHQADVLWRSLAFAPQYRWFRLIRLRAWARGLARLFTGRFYDPRYINSDSARSRAYMAWLSAARLLRLA